MPQTERRSIRLDCRGLEIHLKAELREQVVVHREAPVNRRVVVVVEDLEALVAVAEGRITPRPF
jgi:hypothetical protein